MNTRSTLGHFQVLAYYLNFIRNIVPFIVQIFNYAKYS